MHATMSTTDQNLAADEAAQPGLADVIAEIDWDRLVDEQEAAREAAWTDADERAFADEPTHYSGPARYSGPEPCESCERGGELPCPDCGAVANGEQY